MRHSSEQSPVAVVGAGIAGLACADALTRAGLAAVVFDRGRGPGGRMSTRVDRDDPRGPVFDHGAPFFTAGDPEFVERLDAWRDAGVCERWDTTRSVREGSTIASHDASLWVGTPGMNSLCERLAGGIEIRRSCSVQSVDRVGETWSLRVEEPDRIGSVAGFGTLVLAGAAEQSARLLSGRPADLVARLQGISSNTVWALMVRAQGDTDSIPDILESPGDPVVSHVVRNDRKPGRVARRGEAWLTVYAQAAWSRPRANERHEDIAPELAHEASRVLSQSVGAEVEVIDSSAHRWGLARPETTIEACALSDEAHGLAVCGDGFGDSGVEAAYLSGRAAARSVLAMRGAAV